MLIMMNSVPKINGGIEMNAIRQLSIVISVYNEEAVLNTFYEHITPVLKGCDCDYELIFVNDGSKDASPAILDRLASQSEKVKVVHFARNYGHEAAMIAGIDYSSGDGVICMDADLQHPVECIPQILEKFNEGYEVITMVRTANESAAAWKKITSGAFYKLLNKISEIRFDENASDFFAMTRQPAEILKKHFRESNRFLRAYIQSVGFNKTTMEYQAHERAAGESKYNFKKLWKFSISALLSFSNLPLKISTACGWCSAIVCFLCIIYTIATKITTGTPSGYATIIVVMCFMFMVLFFLIGIIGEYLSVILAEVRQRPIYIVKDTCNLEEKE